MSSLREEESWLKLVNINMEVITAPAGLPVLRCLRRRSPKEEREACQPLLCIGAPTCTQKLVSVLPLYVKAEGFDYKAAATSPAIRRGVHFLHTFHS